MLSCSKRVRRLRRVSIIFQMMSLTFFVSGSVLPALCARMCVEACRFPWFYEQGVKDQMAISLLVLIVSLGGILWRLL